MKKTALLFSVGILLLIATANASVSIATINGNWSSASTWDCSQVPGNNDTMWIPPGFTVTMDINSPEYQGMLVIVDGVFYFDNGQKLNICNGGVYVSNTGILAGDNPGSKINICGQTVWVGPDSTYGPLSYGNAILPPELVDFNGDTHILGSGETSGTDLNARMPAPGNGVNEIETDRDANFTNGSSLNVYPNPSNGTFTILFDNNQKSESSVYLVQIFDGTGQVVKEQSLAGTGNGFSEVVDSGLPPGIYFVRTVVDSAAWLQSVVIK